MLIESSVSDRFAQILYIVGSWCHDVWFSFHWPKQVKWLNLESRDSFLLRPHYHHHHHYYCCCCMFLYFYARRLEDNGVKSYLSFHLYVQGWNSSCQPCVAKYFIHWAVFYFLVWRGGKSQIAKIAKVKRFGGIIV